MKYKFLRISLLSVLAVLFSGSALGAFLFAAGDEPSSTAETTSTITATWDFTNENATCANVAFQGNGGTVASDVDGIELTVDATSGKFNSADRNGDVQVNEGTIIQIPVVSTNDKVTVVGNYVVNYTIGGEAVTELNKTYTATAADVKTGCVTITATAGSTYFYSITVVQDLSAAGEGNGGGSDGGDVATDVTATWDFVKNCANLDTKANGGEYTEAIMASNVDGIFMTIVYNGGQIKNNDNSYMVGKGVEMQIPVKHAKDVVTVVGYPGYFHYSVAGVEATEQTTSYIAKPSDAEKGYVSVVATDANNYINSISVTQYAPKSENIQEKSLYKTDFSDWEAKGASKTPFTISKTTKYTNETLNFELYQVASMSTEDSKFANYTTLPHMTLRAEKAADPYITTTALASITKVRFVHGATGSKRGYKLEAKGDGDADWVTISESVADPAGWCEVTANVNRTNCQLRFTNLTDNQNAYMFELEIFGYVDLSGAPLLGGFKVNGTEYFADEVFEMNTTGDYEGTVEVSKSAAMISEGNPLTDIYADNGEIGAVTYATNGEGASQKTTVTIPVSTESGSVNYILNVVFKPDFILTYYDVEGKEAGTQTVEKDAKIGQFDVDVADVKATKEGYKARGWFKNNYVGEKYTTEDVITDNTKLYAVETEIEGPSDSRKYEFDLTQKTFYAEDHEAFNVIGSGKYHNNHGWIFGTGDKIELLVGKKASIILTLCQYSADDKITASNGAEVNSMVASDGGTASFEYEGEEGVLTLTIQKGSVYIHKITIMNTTTTNYEKNGDWIFVKQGDASSLLDAIAAANGTSGTDRIYIYVPNGTYDLGQTTLTAIGRNNISIIGESQDGVIIKNKPVAEGIGVTAVFLNTANGTYMQDLTLKNDYDYAGNDGRAVCLQDKGTNTICKNVTMLSYQDTYYSNNAKGNFYFETSEIHGTVDFICGGGQAYFNKSLIYVEGRGGEGKGSCTITAPYTEGTTYGYVFNECTIENHASEFNFGRAWGGEPKCAWLNTTMKLGTGKIASNRWTTAGMNVAAKEFYEYNSMDESGKVISPASNILTFTHSNGNNANFETILTAEQAAEFTLAKVMGDWAPNELAAQFNAPTAALKDGTISWTAVEGAMAYAVFADGKLLTITEGTSYVVVGGDAAVMVDYTIRTINKMGGMGQAAAVSGTTAISTVPTDNGKADIYNLQGQRVNKATHGIYIIGGKKVVVK